jgi:microsomal epoxide hydrolase
MAYILEKYSLGTFAETKDGLKDGGLEAYEKDDLLTIVTLYWMTNTITSSIRFYKNSVVPLDSMRNIIKKSHIPQQVPVAVHYFKHEVGQIPYKVAKSVYPNLKSFNLVSFGGHFASFENPELSADDIIEFVKSC